MRTERLTKEVKRSTWTVPKAGHNFSKHLKRKHSFSTKEVLPAQSAGLSIFNPFDCPRGLSERESLVKGGFLKPPLKE